MREIKFRVWDIRNKEFIKDTRDPHFWINPFDFKTFIEWRPEYDGSLVFEPEDELFIFQQYTGFKGPNNQEIYEGDILELIPAYENMDLQYDYIKWSDGAWIVHDGYLHEFTSCPIVGNIYETKL